MKLEKEVIDVSDIICGDGYIETDWCVEKTRMKRWDKLAFTAIRVCFFVGGMWMTAKDGEPFRITAWMRHPFARAYMKHIQRKKFMEDV